MKLYNMREQLKGGKHGEELFDQLCPEYIPRPSFDMSYDRIISHPHPNSLLDSRRTKIEVKADYYKTGNVCIEAFSKHGENIYKGGPWRASDADADIVYIFPNLYTLYWFDSDALCEYIDSNTGGYKRTKMARNSGGGYSEGYIIPLNELEILNLTIEKSNFSSGARTIERLNGKLI